MTWHPVLAEASVADQILLVVVLAVALALYVSQKLPSELVSLLLIVSLPLTRLLTVDEAFSGFSHKATITVAAMFVLSSGLVRTGALEFVALKVAGFSRGSYWRILLTILLVVPPASAFINNTPIVVMMVPVVLSICRQFSIPPSKLLIPLSYASILGGTCTLLGTSTNIIVADSYRDFARRYGDLAPTDPWHWRGPVPLDPAGFDLFDFTPVGVGYFLVGGVFLLLFARRLLPSRPSLSGLLGSGRKADFVTEVVVPAGSRLVGQKAGEAFQGSKVRLLELLHGEEMFLGGDAHAQTIEADTSLIVVGTPQEIDDFLTATGANLTTVVEDDARVPMRTFELRLAEAVILPYSKYEGLTVSELGLNRRFGVKVLAVQRQGRHHRYRIRAMKLIPGDVLLIQGDPNALENLREQEGLLVVEGVERTFSRPRKAPVAVGIIAVVVLLAVFDPFGLHVAIYALFGAVAMMLTRCLRADEAFRALDGRVLLLLAAMIPLGQALETSGLAQSLVRGIVAISLHENPVVFLSLFYLMTSLLTEIVSNNAVAALMVPIALELAETLHINHEPLLICVAFGASASFFTPFGYQTNAIVMGPGGYTFRDYLRIGLPMNLLMWATATVLIPWFWPLVP